MKRLLALFVAGLLTACTAPGPTPGPTFRPFGVQAEAVPGVVCRIGRDGGPIVADRGIGGTGAHSVQAATQIADRGIGGTGIVGVVTGFASVCVNGLEVQYNDTVAVDVDGTAATPSALRAGQIVVIKADGSASAPYARTISVRNELVGRIELVTLDSPMLMIAGQPVWVPAGTLGAERFGLGDWVTVSGLRREDGVVVASRLEAATSRKLVARGLVVRDGNALRVGNLVIEGAVAKGVKPGQFVSVSGSYSQGHGQADAVVVDPLSTNPAAYFGRSVDRLIVQAYVRVAKGTIWLNGVKIAAGPSVHHQAKVDGLAIVSLKRRSDGSFIAVDLRFAEAGADEASRGGAGPWKAYASIMTPWLRPVAAISLSGRNDARAGSDTDGQAAPVPTAVLGQTSDPDDASAAAAAPEDLSSPPSGASQASEPAVIDPALSVSPHTGTLVISGNGGSGPFAVAVTVSGPRSTQAGRRPGYGMDPDDTPMISLVSGALRSSSVDLPAHAVAR
jgi:hypothetical protein